MSAALQNAKDPARIAVLPSRGSTNPQKDTEMNEKTDNTGTAEKPAPTIHDLHADVSRLVSLIEVAENMVCEIGTGEPNEREIAHLFRAQNLTYLAMECARNLGAQFDAYQNETIVDQQRRGA